MNTKKPVPPVFRADITCEWEGVPCAFTVQVVVPEDLRANSSTADRARETARRAVLGLLPGARLITIDVPPWGDGRLTDRSHAKTPVPPPERKYKPYTPRHKFYQPCPERRLDAIIAKEKS